MWPFKRKPIVDAETSAWHVDNFAWLIRQFGGSNTFADTEVLRDGPLQGWQMAHAGYLPEADLIFALALFLRARSLEVEEACSCLKPHLATMLRRALRDLVDDDPRLLAVRQALASGAPS